MAASCWAEVALRVSSVSVPPPRAKHDWRDRAIFVKHRHTIPPFPEFRMEIGRMSRLPLLFMATAAGCLLGGVALGIGMGIAHDFRLAPVHAHTNLVGWTSLALMGLTLRAWPELAEGRLALVQFALSAGAALVFPVGIYFAIMHDAPGLAIAAGLVWFAGAVLFLARLLRLAFAGIRRGTQGMMPAE
jgi:hypothetical protein